MSNTNVLESRRALAVRRAVPADRPALEAMAGRCGPRTLQRRFQGGVREIPVGYLERVCVPVRGDLHLVALVSPLQTVALASLSDGELGVLVEDEWQQAGIGTLLTRRLLRYACAAGIQPVVAEVGAGNEAVITRLKRLRPNRVVALRYGYRVELDPRRLRRTA